MTTGRRVACLLVPDLVVQAELRAYPELSGHPFVVASGDDGRAEVIAASRQAVAANVHPGHSVAHARAACSGLIVRTASPARERTARQSLLDAALSLSPRAELGERSAPPFAAEAAAFLDASGIGTLFESERSFSTKPSPGFCSMVRAMLTSWSMQHRGCLPTVVSPESITASASS